MSDRLDIKVRKMTSRDLDEIRKVGQDAWSDMASRDLGRKVWYPLRPKRLIESYMLQEPGGCLVAECEGKLVSSAYSHVWGKIGWVGPLEVLPEYQNMGVGKTILRACEDYLRSRGCEVVGVETMCHIPKNIHFYLSAGFVSNRLTLIMEKPLAHGDERLRMAREIGREEIREILPSVASLSRKMHPLLDYSVEFEIVERMGLGSAFVLEEREKLVGAALLHTFRRQGGVDFSSFKLLMVDPQYPDQPAALRDLIRGCEMKSRAQKKKKIYVRLGGDNLPLYEQMNSAGYRIVGANIRMTKPGSYREEGMCHLSSWAG